MHTRPSLRRRLLLWLIGYALLLATAVSAHGFMVNEYAERLLWDSLLETEFDHHLERLRADPDYPWHDTESLSLYIEDGGQPPPPEFSVLTDGIHDEVVMPDGTELLVLVRHVNGKRHVLTLDITDLERKEDQLTVFVLGSAILLVVLMGALMALGLGRALSPLSDMATEISRLQPDGNAQRIGTDHRSSSELMVIANALNGYLERNARFVERERTFINTASHELRTPIAVIDGAAEIGLQAASGDGARHQLQRIQRTARNMRELVTLLLALAKDPSRLAEAGETVDLAHLLPEIVNDHRHLTEGKSLDLVLALPGSCRIHAPPGIVRAAIGNLLRNAIEHSDSGRIDITLTPDATVILRDPGQGMSPEQVSAIYGRLARAGKIDGDGIGLDLIARLCEHLGWRLDIASSPDRGTVATLGLRTLAIVH